MAQLAIDFGTSNTVAALRVDGKAPRLLSVDGWPVLPSAVWLSPDGALVVGRDAERQARLDPARFEPNPKRRVDEVEVLLGDTVVPVVELIAAVLRRVLDEARRQLGGQPDHVVLTHPAGWGAIRTATLASAARRAGCPGPVRLLPEPVAAAAHFVSMPASTVLAVFDLGGGTTDVAVVAGSAQGWQVLAEAGLADVGGADLDQLLLEHIGRQVGTYAPQWQAILRPTDAASRRAARALADDVRAAKEALSRYPHADVPLPAPLPDVHVTRTELEELARPHLERTAALCSSTIALAGLRPGALAGLYLVGGGSRMPLVARLLAERTGILPVTVESPESSVALGALMAPQVPEATQPAARPAAPHATAPQHVPPVHTAPRPTLPVHGTTLWPVDTAPQATGPHGAAGGYPRTTGMAGTARMPGPDSRPVKPRRRGLAVAGALLGVVAVGAAVAIGVSLLNDDPGGAGPTSSSAPTSTTASSTTSTTSTQVANPGGATPPEPVAASAAAKEEPFGGDADLRSFAGAAVDRAINCTDPGGTAKGTLGLRTQVQCVYKLGDDLYYASFFSSDRQQSCQQLAGTIALAGRNVTDGAWDGGGRNGTWKDATLSIPTTNNITYYADSGGLLCGLVEGDEESPLELGELHDQWYVVVRPGS